MFCRTSWDFCNAQGGNVTSTGWQVTLCDPIWHMSSCSGEACCELLYPVTLLTYYLCSLMVHYEFCYDDDDDDDLEGAI